MPYLAHLEREGRGCKIVVDGYCFGQRLLTAIFHFKPYKTTENERENERKLNPCLLVLVKNPNFSNPSFPESTSLRATGSRTVVVQKPFGVVVQKPFGGRGRKKGKKKKEGKKKTGTCLFLK